MKKKMRKLKINFWSLVVVVMAIVSYFVMPAGAEVKRIFFPLVMVLAGLLMVLGGGLVYLTRRMKIKGKLRWFLVLAGGAGALFLPFVVLHNLVSGLLGIEEAVFFILAIFVCPLAGLVGIVGGVVVMAKGKV